MVFVLLFLALQSSMLAQNLVVIVFSLPFVCCLYVFGFLLKLFCCCFLALLLFFVDFNPLVLKWMDLVWGIFVLVVGLLQL
jgi:hypothetical protein